MFFSRYICQMVTQNMVCSCKSNCWWLKKNVARLFLFTLCGSFIIWLFRIQCAPVDARLVNLTFLCTIQARNNQPCNKRTMLLSLLHIVVKPATKLDWKVGKLWNRLLKKLKTRPRFVLWSWWFSLHNAWVMRDLFVW